MFIEYVNGRFLMHGRCPYWIKFGNARGGELKTDPNCWMSPDFKIFLPPQPWRPREALTERVPGSRGCQGSWEHSCSPWKYSYITHGNTYSCSSPAGKGPGVGQKGCVRSGEGLQRSRDKTELGAMLASDKGCIHKRLGGGRLSPGAEKKGWPSVLLPKGWVPAAIMAPKGGGQHWREKFNTTNLSPLCPPFPTRHCKFPVKPV